MLVSFEAKNHLIYGPVASGKTTLAKSWAQRSGLEYLSVGDITRDEMANKTATGLILRECFDQWVPYPVDVITTLISSKVSQVHAAKRGLILDGFPKFPDEATALMSDKSNLVFRAAVVLTLPLSESMGRMARRRICVSCKEQTTLSIETDIKSCGACGGALTVRDDDRPEIVRRRYDDFAKSIDKTLAIMSPSIGKIVRLDGLNTQNELLDKVLAI